MSDLATSRRTTLAIALGILTFSPLTESAFAQETVWSIYAGQADTAAKAGNVDEAIRLWSLALAEAEKQGKFDSRVAASLNALARLDFVRGRYDVARPKLERALTIRERALGPNHPDIAATLNDLAIVHRVQREYDQAETLSRRALTVQEKATPVEPTALASILANLAALLDATGKPEHSQPLRHRAITLLRPEHTDAEDSPILHSFRLVAVAHRLALRGDYACAELMLRNALDLQLAEGCSRADFLYAAMHTYIAARCDGQYQIEKADSHYRRALDAWERSVVTDGGKLGRWADWAVYLESLELGDDQPLFLVRRAVEIRRATFFEGARELKPPLECYAMLLLATRQQFCEASAVFRELAAINASIFPNFPITILAGLRSCITSRHRLSDADDRKRPQCYSIV